MSETATRAGEVDRLRRAIGWEWPQVCKRLRMSYQDAGKLRRGEGEIADSDLDYLRRVALVVDAVPRTDEEAMTKDQLISAAVECYAESYTLGEDGPGARHAIGELLAKLGWLDDARTRLRAVAAAGATFTAPEDPQPEDAREESTFQRLPFAGTSQG